MVYKLRVFQKACSYILFSNKLKERVLIILIVILCSVVGNSQVGNSKFTNIQNPKSSKNEWGVIESGNKKEKTILLEAMTNYVITFTIQSKVSKGKCDCFEWSRNCYLYQFTIDSILYLENDKNFDLSSLKNLQYFSSINPYLRIGVSHTALFRDGQTNKYISLERFLPVINNENLYFDKEVISLAGECSCIGNKKYPFCNFFKNKN